MSRASQISVDSGEALERAALLGREFPLALLRASGIDDRAIAGLFDDGLLLAGPRPCWARFADSTRPRKIVRSIPWSRARDHHLVLGEASKAQRCPPEDTAIHFEAAQRFDLARAQWLKAGEARCGAGEYRNALRFIDRALAVWPWDEAPEDRVAVLRQMARYSANARMEDQARKAWEELADHARETLRPGLLAESLGQLAALSADGAKTGVLLAEAAAIATRDLAPAEACRHLFAHVDFLATRVRIFAARQAFPALEDAAHASADPALVSEMLGLKSLVAAMAGEAEDAKAHAAESLHLALEHGLREQVAAAYKRRANIADYAGDYVLQCSSHHEAIRYCAETGTEGAASCMSCLSYAFFRIGDWKQAVETTREVLRDLSLHRGLRAIALGVRGLVSTFRGERGSAARFIEDALRLIRAEGIVGMELLTLWALAFWHDSGGDREAASATYDEIRALWRECDDVHDAIPGLLFAGGHYADLGRAAQLADCIDILGQIRRRNDLPEVRAALLALGAEQARLDGDPAAAERSFEDAMKLEIRAGLPLERLWIESRRDPARDRAEALALATRLDARPLVSLLKSVAETGGPLVPTPRQLEVLVFLAAGLTSKEIADRMSLSTRTVEMHVGRLLQRLDCRTRPEAVALAHSRGWLRLP